MKFLYAFLKSNCTCICVALLLFCSAMPHSVRAQTPQYRKKQVPTTVGYVCHLNPAQDTTPPRKIQLIYKPGKHFPNAPRGNIKAIYFRTGEYISNPKFNNPGFAYNVQMSLGWTVKDTFRKLSQTNPNLRDTFLTGLTPVYTTPVLRQNVKDSGLKWMKFPLQGSGFLYDSSEDRNLVVEITFGPPFVNNYFCLYDSSGGGAQQMLVGYRDTPSVYRSFRDPIVGTFASVDFGFDLSPVGVEAGTFGGSFTVYPNPSNGSFRINVDAVTAMKQVAISVRNITGQSVFEHTYQPGRNSFSEEISLPSAAKGVYIVEMVAEGERILQRVLIE